MYLRHLRWITILAVCLWGMPAFATDMYFCECSGDADGDCVAGDDANDGLTAGNAKETLGAFNTAGQSASCGDRFLFCEGGHFVEDTVHLQPFPLNSALDCRTAGQGGSSANIEYTSYEASWVTGDEEKPKWEQTDPGEEMFMFGGVFDMRGLTFSDLHFYCDPATMCGSMFKIEGGNSTCGTLTIEDCDLEGFWITLYSKTGTGDCTGFYVLDNEIHEANSMGLMMSEARDVVITGNYFHDNGCGPGSGPCGEDHHIYNNDNNVALIANNEFYNNSIDGSGNCVAAAVIRNSGNDIVIEDNWLHEDVDNVGSGCWGIAGTHGTGLGGCTDCIIRRNRITNYKRGITATDMDAVVIENNVIEYLDGFEGDSCTGLYFDHPDYGSSVDLIARNNTVLFNDTDNCSPVGMYKHDDTGSGFEWYGNVIVVDDGGSDGVCFSLNDNDSYFDEIDNNTCFFESGSSGYYGSIDGTPYTALSNWTSSTTWGDDSQESDPGLDADGSVTGAGSNVVDQGQASTTTTAMSEDCNPTNLNWIDSCGSAPSRSGTPDMGAYEYIASSVCGDDVTEGAEACDDGNETGSDGCEADCLSITTGWGCNIVSEPSVCGNLPLLGNETVDTVAENVANDTVVDTITAAVDADSDGIAYTITGGNTGTTFAINSSTGQIAVLSNTVLDFETNPSFVLEVTATDDSALALTDTGDITVGLTNVNEAPVLADAGDWTIAENSANTTEVDTAADSYSDVDAGDTVTYSEISGDTDAIFTIHATTGMVTVTDNTALNHEATGSYEVVYRATDAGTLYNEGTMTITVTDVNEAPVFGNDAWSVAEDAANSTVVDTIDTATDVDDGDVLTYTEISGDPDGIFTIHATTGAYTVTDNTDLDIADSPMTIVLRATDDGAGTLWNEGTITLTINIDDNVCGDGSVDLLEECDDSDTDNGDGCSENCTIEPGWDCTGEPSVCTEEPSCGDGVIEGAEECDDGNATASDGCSATCTEESGYTCSGEPSICEADATCGDGSIEGSEGCDDSGVVAGDGCNATCQVELGWVCTGEPSVCTVPDANISLRSGGLVRSNFWTLRPLPTPATRVWFVPNEGSTDMVDLFTSPDDWATARARVDVFTFYAGQVSTVASCQGGGICGDNYAASFVSADAFTLLDTWGIKTNVDVMYMWPTYYYGTENCGSGADITTVNVDAAKDNIAVINTYGGSVEYLAMDEPLAKWMPQYYYIYTGTTDPGICRYSVVSELATDVASFITQVQATYPAVKIGQNELYPEVGADTIKAYIQALFAAGVNLEFLHLDVHVQRYNQYKSWDFPIDMETDIKELAATCERYGIPFGVMFTDANWQSNYDSGYTDQTYFDAAKGFVTTITNMVGAQRDAIFQSWVYGADGQADQRITPINLPDNSSVYSHTRLLLEGMEIIDAAD